MTIKDFYWFIAVVIIISAIIDRIQHGFSYLALPAAIAAIYLAFEFFHAIGAYKHGNK